MNCLKCGKPLQEDAKFCMGCGQRVPRCPTCGTVLQKRAKFCMVDGTRIPDEINALFPEEPAENTPKPKTEEAPAAEQTPAQEEKPKPIPTPPAPQPPVEEPAAPKQAPAQKKKIVQEKKPAPQPPVKEPAAPKQEKKKPAAPKQKKKLIIPIIAVAAAVCVLLLGFLAGKAWLAGAGEEKTQSAATDATGETPEQNTEAAEPAQPETTQPPETTLPQIQPVEAEPILMPNCVGWHYDEVVQAFVEIPCQLNFEYAYSDTVGENYVLQQNLPEGSELTAETAVVITLSKGPDVAPEGYNQKVTVTAASDSSYGILTLYDWENGQWAAKFSCDATLGSMGISADYGEGRKRTPAGVYKLGVALTANGFSNPDWPMYMVTSDTCVVDDVDSPLYNTIQSIQSLPGGVSYDPIGGTIAEGTSNICIYIEHNGNGQSSTNVVPGNGSVITICGRYDSLAPTSGCVDISASNMDTLISMLSYSRNAHIEIYTQ